MLLCGRSPSLVNRNIVILAMPDVLAMCGKYMGGRLKSDAL